MSQRLRIVFAASCLAAAIFLLTPPPSHAGAFGLRAEAIAASGLLDQVWSWLSRLWPGGTPTGAGDQWVKDGGASNPNGGTQPPPPSQPTSTPTAQVTVTAVGIK
jgi:hypothetical protein